MISVECKYFDHYFMVLKTKTFGSERMEQWKKAGGWQSVVHGKLVNF